MFEEKIIKNIKNLKNLGAVALKASFEDEGVSDSDLGDLILLSNAADLRVYVKIGGCEANRDIDACIRYNINTLVAPMVESSFAVSKFLDSVSNKSHLMKINSPKCFINLETITACKEARQILADHHDRLSGVVIGRSDLCRSMGLTKQNVDDKEVIKVVSSTLEIAKEYGLQTKMGGSVSKSSLSNIITLKEHGLLDGFETRAVVFSLKKCEDIHTSILSAINYEQSLLSKRKTIHQIKYEFFDDRIEKMESRK